MYASLNVTSVPQLLPPFIHNEDPLRYNAGPYIELDIVLQTEMVLKLRTADIKLNLWLGQVKYEYAMHRDF